MTTDSVAENPPAFPPHSDTFDYVGVQTGMDLRDYFAALVLPVLIPMKMTDAGGYDLPLSEQRGAKASCAYAYADLMLAQRKATKP